MLERNIEGSANWRLEPLQGFTDPECVEAMAL
jgi:hypothetical protein